MQRWAYAADALEELCPGAASATSTADLSRHWNPSPSPSTSHASAGSVGGVNGGNGGEKHAADHDPPTAVVAAAASAAGDVDGVQFNPKPNHVAVSAEQQQTAAAANGGGGGDEATLCVPACSLSAASALPQPTPAAIPVAEAVALPAAALAGRAPQPRQPQQRPHGQDVLSLPAAACSEETLVAVARELQEYAEAVATARSSREAKAGGKSGGGSGGRDVAGGALGAGALGAVSPSLYLQEPPAEGLFDALLDEVLQALGDA